MKLGDLKVTVMRIVAALFLSISVPTKTQTSGDEFPSLVGMYMEQYVIYLFF